MKETDIVLTSDEWRIALSIELSAYHDIVATVKSELLLVEQQKQAFTPVSELQVERLLYVLDSRLNEFYQILPRLDTRRGLINIVGVALKLLFGTAIDSDVRALNDVVNELQLKNDDIVYSLADQLTFVKDLSTSNKVNADAIAYLAAIVRYQVIRPHDEFQEIASEILWLNVTLFGQSTLFMHIRQLEVALLQIT
jgi:hypothetical protein